MTIWANLLYAHYDPAYLTYPQLQEAVCPRDDTFCLAVLYQLEFVGRLCFGIFVCAFLISGYDFYRIVRFFLGEITTRSKFFVEQSSVEHFKNNFRSLLMVAAYLLGLTLQVFAVSLLQIEQATYGPSFYLFLASFLLFALPSLWENRKMSRLLKQELVIKLLEKEKEVLRDDREDELSRHSSGQFSI